MKLNFIDKAVMYANPEKGLRRSLARAAISMTGSTQKRYAAGDLGRLRDDRTATVAGPDALTQRHLVTLRARARAQVRDNGLAKRMRDLWVHHLIGEGITTTFYDRDGVGKIAAKRQNEMFQEWFNSPLCDSTGLSDGHGLFSLATGMAIRDGDGLIRKVVIGPDHPDFHKMKIPLKLQVLEPDFLDHNKNGLSEDGNPIVMGVEYDKKYPDVRVKYWLFDQHPGERRFGTWGLAESRPVPASEIIHIFVRDGNNSRGVTWFHPVLDIVHDFKEYLDALRMKAKIEACFSVIVTSAANSQAAPLTGQTQAEGMEDYDELAPGIVRYARPGETVNSIDPSNSSGHAILSQTLVRLAAAGMGLTYDQAWSDLTGANYSSLRAGKMEFNRSVRQKQFQLLDPAAAKVAGWFIEVGKLASFWKTTDFKAEITFDPPDVVDPYKDGAAEKQDIEMGLDTISEKLTARGKDPAEHWAKLKTEVDFLKATFGDVAIHPFLQTLMGKTPAAPDDDDEQEQPPKKPVKKKAA